MTAESMDKFDVVIIGGGPAGISCALWCDEIGLRAIILEASSELGGQLHWIHNPVKNYLGIETRNGLELRDIFLRQISSRRFTTRMNCKVTSLDAETKTVSCTDGSVFRAGAIVIATGVRRRKLGVPGESEFMGRGILESGVRDRELVRGKRVCIIGGGDAALENALLFSELAAEVFLVRRRREFRAREEFVSRVIGNPKIQLIAPAEVVAISGSSHLEKISLRELQSNSTREIVTDFLLTRIGVKPNLDFMGDAISRDEAGYIFVSSEGETNLNKIYAIGDIANPKSPTITSAVGMGATVAKAIQFWN